MKINRVSPLVAIASIALPILCTSSVAALEVRPEKPVALVGGQVLDGYEVAPITDGVVIFEKGIITAVGSSKEVSIPANAEIVDVGGHTILPALLIITFTWILLATAPMSVTTNF